MPAPLRVGTVLIASLDLEDPNFHRTVVLIIQHDEKEGTLGLVLNRPLGDKINLYSTTELQQLAQTDDAVRDATDELGGMFFQGGPVEPGYLFFLHRLSGVIQGGSETCPGVYLGGDLDTIRAEASVMESADPVVRFYLGYAGWKEDQLEAEIAIGAWFLCDGHPRIIFETDPEQMWQKTLYSLGGKYRALSLIPPNPEVN